MATASPSPEPSSHQATPPPARRASTTPVITHPFSASCCRWPPAPSALAGSVPACIARLLGRSVWLGIQPSVSGGRAAPPGGVLRRGAVPPPGAPPPIIPGMPLGAEDLLAGLVGRLEDGVAGVVVARCRSRDGRRGPGRRLSPVSEKSGSAMSTPFSRMQAAYSSIRSCISVMSVRSKSWVMPSRYWRAGLAGGLHGLPVGRVELPALAAAGGPHHLEVAVLVGRGVFHVDAVVPHALGVVEHGLLLSPRGPGGCGGGRRRRWRPLREAIPWRLPILRSRHPAAARRRRRGRRVGSGASVHLLGRLGGQARPLGCRPRLAPR